MITQNTIEKKIKVGDILLATWGYDACLADFYKVTARKNKTIVMVKLANHNTGDWCSGTSSPAKPENMLGTPVKRLIKTYNNNEYVKGISSGYAYIWNGKPVNTYNHH
jgi:hypothetical protein